MGKPRQAQRTKNNAKPSNSGRSAEFLCNMSQFSGFTGMKETGFIFSTMTSEDIELNIDANFQLVFKKMNKKDNTTKIKALQEFGDLVKNSDVEVVKSILPCWPRLYNALATDSEHKVREATHSAHNEVVQKVKRNLAPYLKSLIAAWFTSQYDTYPPAATAATLSFKNAFPENKVEEVLAFCNKEILDYVYDNLFVQTTQTVANPKHNTSEELVAKLERVLISSLHGYCLYLKKTPREKIEESIELNRKIVNNNKFWKYSKHSVGVIRAAWYEVLISIFEKAPFLLENEESHAVSYTLGNIDETNPIVLPLVWQNVLLAITSIKDWHTRVKVDKLMFPKLWKVLKDGGQGNAAVIFPNLLPLLSNMMDIIDADTFYSNFFQNLTVGLKQKSVQASRSEWTAVSTSLIECLRYVIMKNEVDIPLCEKIIKSFLISTVHWCLMENRSCHKIIFNETASLVQYWSRNSLNENYSRYLKYFWDSINSLIEGVLIDLDCSNSDKVTSVVENQIEFLKTMKHLPKTKKSLKVKFDPETEPIETKLENVTLDRLDEFYLECLTNSALKTCSTYLKLIDDNKSKELFDHLATLMDEFNSKMFFDRLATKVGQGEHRGNSFVFEKLKNWLECQALQCKSLVHIFFITFKHLEYDDKKLVLDALNEISNEECLGWCLEEALSYQYNREPLIRQWLIAEKVTNFLIDIVDKEISNCCPSNLSALFKLAVTENDDEELYVSEKAISEIIKKLRGALQHPGDFSSIDTIVSLAAYLSAVVYTKNYGLKYTDELLLSLIKLCCETTINPEYLSDDTVWEAQTAWQDALSLLSGCLPKEQLESLIDNFVMFVHQSLEVVCLQEEKMEKVIEVLISFCRAIYKSIHLEMNGILSKLFDNDFITKQRSSVVDICEWAEYVNGYLTSCYEEFEVGSEFHADGLELPRFFTWIYVKANVLFADVQKKEEDENEEGDDQTENMWSSLNMEIEWVSQTLYDLELLKCFLENYEPVRFSLKIKDLTERALSICESSLKSFTGEVKHSLLSSLRKEALSHSWLWTRTLYTVQKRILELDPVQVYEDLLKDVTVDDKLAVLHATQVFAEHLNYDYVARTYDDVGRIITLRCLAKCQGIDVQIAEVMSILGRIRNDKENFNWENFELDWIPYQIVLETCRLFNELMIHQFDSLSGKQIDLIIISMTEWLQRVAQMAVVDKVKPMIIAVVSLYRTIRTKINELRNAEMRLPLVKEWDALFAEAAQNDLVKLWLSLSGHFKIAPSSILVKELPVMYSFALMSDCFDHNLIFKETEEMSKRRSKLVDVSWSFLHNTTFNTLLLAAHKTLRCLIPGFVDLNSKAVVSKTPNKDGLFFEKFKDIFIGKQQSVCCELIDVEMGDGRIEPSLTTSCGHILAYLMMWDIMLSFCDQASTELKYLCVDWLKEDGKVRTLLNHLFVLMPKEIYDNLESKNLYLAEWFSSRVEFNARKIFTSDEFEHMVCWVYYSTFLQLPVLVRQWWTGVDNRTAQVFGKLTSTYVSPLICNQELKDVMEHEKKFKNMKIKVLPTVREVIAVYTVDEVQMELIITLPSNYPLSGPDVQCNRQIGGTSHKQWLMQFKKCVLHQNGRIWDGLSLWNSNLDKKFDGVEECYICFAVLHTGTYQIPKLSCQTCKKKFHSACLYKWFSTSNKSSCPICRNLF